MPDVSLMSWAQDIAVNLTVSLILFAAVCAWVVGSPLQRLARSRSTKSCQLIYLGDSRSFCRMELSRSDWWGLYPVAL